MTKRYVTAKGSVYICKHENGRELWFKQDHEGQIHPLVEAVHISADTLKELVQEYPHSLMDKTYCFDLDVEREFLEDARRERFIGDIQSNDTVICFLTKRGPDAYSLGCSSRVTHIIEQP